MRIIKKAISVCEARTIPHFPPNFTPPPGLTLSPTHGQPTGECRVTNEAQDDGLSGDASGSF
jgi:hypothetical protein